MKIGYCDGHRLLCAVKTANSNSTVRSYEPNQRLIDAISAKTTTRKVSTLDVLIPHKVYYIELFFINNRLNYILYYRNIFY